MINFSTKRIALKLSLCVLGIFALNNPITANELGQILFKEADTALAAANEAQANLLAPTNYSKAVDYYKSARERLNKGQSIDAIKKDLTSASGYLTKAVEATRLAEVSLAGTIDARNGAIAADAKNYSAKTWQNAEESFSSAATRLESGNVKRASRDAEKAKSLYEDAELDAIKNHYLSSARNLIAKAKDEKANRFAPLTLEKAENLLQQADHALEANRYDLDEPRSLAKEAMYEAGHAIQITRVAKSINDKAMSNEELILKMEKPIVRVAENFNLIPYFDGSILDPIADIQKQIALLQTNSFELGERRQEILGLEKTINELEKRLGVQSDRLANQEARNKKVQQVESLFTAEEASVLKKGDSLIIRMVGLNFQSGKASIDTEYFALLRKVKMAIETFPNAEVMIEGHTDSFGTDSLNLTLSQQRAESVRRYLEANMDASYASHLNAEGYGETRPIGNNETEDGRRKNRRIDLVIHN